jgi:predicted nucleic acid-binding protein
MRFMIELELPKDALFSLDTNIFIYSFDPSDARKQQVAQALIAAAQRLQAPVVTQVIGEIFKTMASVQNMPSAYEHASEFGIELARALPVIHADSAVFQTAMQLSARYKRQFWDCLIVATCAAHGVKTLYTEDLGGSPHKLLGVQLVNPFSNV